MNWLEALYAEQTTPDEVVIFILLGTAATLLVAFVAYSIILVALSKWRMSRDYSLRAILFPSNKQLRKYAAEYTLGTFTALLLALTVAAKHQAVDAVLAQDIRSIGHEAVRSAMPLRRLTEEELREAGADDSTAAGIAAWISDGASSSISIKLESIVRPLLQAGQAESAYALVRAIVDGPGSISDTRILRYLLLFASVLLLAGYVSWYSTQRWRELRQEQTNEPGYAALLKRLSLPAVCVPLLFVSTIALDDPKRIIDGAIGAVNAAEISDSTYFARAINRQVEEQASRGAAIDASDLNEINDSLQALSNLVASLNDRASDLEARISSSERSLSSAIDATGNESRRRSDQIESALVALNAELDRHVQFSGQQSERLVAMIRNATNDIATHTNLINGLDARVRRLESSIQQLSNAVGQQSGDIGLLLVQNLNGNGNYQVRRTNNSIAAQGSGLGLHALPPGTYLVSGNRAQQNVRRSLTANSAITVSLQFVVQ